MNRSQVMEIKELASLRPRAAASPIEVRVVRIWKPPFRDNETCFLLVDKHGDGIQAIAKGKDQSYAENNLLPKSCYRIEGYACVESEPYVNTLSHPANLSIGVASTFTPIAESNDFPHQYFEFASHRKIQRICGNNKEVTDFIGLLLKVEDKSTKTQRPYVSLILKDTSNENIEVALWEEISKTSTRFDRKAIEGSTYPTVLAVTAVKVKEFSSKCKLYATQLWSTRATHVYLNPTCAKTEILITKYRLQATISDDTCSINATLFDEAVKILVGIECADLVTKSTSTDMTSIPLPVLEISGKTTKFHAQASKDTRSGAIRCVVNKVTMAEINTENDLLTIRPTTVPRTPQPQQAPSRNQLAIKRLNLFPEGNTLTKLIRFVY
ncbi:hypothetical protein E3N88_22319 [Mikania micrantha]|uniref:Replication protein A OB domain-containing protein n=1 Tax=Mikania micrantha TaxID=192012 RepID=A0A5N6NCN9_9ASTR|nr:hypothetical protein E3N88_22319 [Mikania micrantha]